MCFNSKQKNAGVTALEEAKKVTRQMYAGMSDEECQQALP